MAYKRMEGNDKIYICRNAPIGRERCPNFNKEMRVKTGK